MVGRRAGGCDMCCGGERGSALWLRVMQAAAEACSCPITGGGHRQRARLRIVWHPNGTIIYRSRAAIEPASHCISAPCVRASRLETRAHTGLPDSGAVGRRKPGTAASAREQALKMH